MAKSIKKQLYFPAETIAAVEKFRAQFKAQFPHLKVSESSGYVMLVNEALIKRELLKKPMRRG